MLDNSRFFISESSNLPKNALCGAVMKKIEVFTDGACSGNPGIGGWGAVLRYGKAEKELCGAHDATTNNRMEMTAVISALKALKEPCEVDLYTDSQYVMKGATEWMDGWVKTGGEPQTKNPFKTAIYGRKFFI